MMDAEDQRLGKNEEWKPWKDLLGNHSDAVLLVQAFSDSERGGVMTASADGLVAIYVHAFSISVPLSLEQSFRLESGGVLRQPSGVDTAGVARAESLTSLTTDTAPDSAFACSDCGSLPPSILCGGGVKGSVFAWSAQGCLLAEMEGHTAAVTQTCCLCTFKVEEDYLKSQGPDLATASLDTTIRIWQLGIEDPTSAGSSDAGYSGCLFILELGLRNPVADLALLSAEELLVATWDGQIRFVSLPCETGETAGTAVSCSQALQATIGQVRSICKWRRKADEEWQIFAGTDEGEISCWAPCAHSLVSAANLLPAWNQRLSWQGHRSHVISLSTCKDWLVSCAEDKLVRVWDATSGKLLADFWGHSAGVVCTCMSWPLLWTGSRDHTVRSWDFEEVERRLRELATMEMCDAQSFHYEVTFSRLTAKQLKKMAAAAKAASKAERRRGNTRR